MREKVEKAAEQNQTVKVVPESKENASATHAKPLNKSVNNDTTQALKKDQDHSNASVNDDILKEIEEKLLSSQNECQETYDRLLRTSAEFENFKKRTAREMGDLRKYANESIIKEMLPIIDNLERALQSSEEAELKHNGIVEGVDMTLKEILKVFKKNGVIPVDAVDQPFDPNYHQAVMQEETDEHPEHIVLKELQKGYLMHDRLIRPAMVVVSKSKKQGAATNGGQPEENPDTQEETEAIKD